MIDLTGESDDEDDGNFSGPATVGGRVHAAPVAPTSFYNNEVQPSATRRSTYSRSSTPDVITSVGVRSLVESAHSRSPRRKQVSRTSQPGTENNSRLLHSRSSNFKAECSPSSQALVTRDGFSHVPPATSNSVPFLKRTIDGRVKSSAAENRSFPTASKLATHVQGKVSRRYQDTDGSSKTSSSSSASTTPETQTVVTARSQLPSSGSTRIAYTPEDVRKLVYLREKKGVRWTDMPSYFPGRSCQSLQVRYSKHVVHHRAKEAIPQDTATSPELDLDETRAAADPLSTEQGITAVEKRLRLGNHRRSLMRSLQKIKTCARAENRFNPFYGSESSVFLARSGGSSNVWSRWYESRPTTP